MATSKHTKRKLFIISLLIIAAMLVTVYCQAFLDTGTVFPHLFYIPIILSSVWWGRSGTGVAALLGGILIGAHLWFQPQGTLLAELLRGLIFLFVSGFVVWCGAGLARERNTVEMLLQKRTEDLALALRQKETAIFERKKIEAQLIRTDRLASLGQLSSGIAHEIRNPLAGIRLFLDILGDPEKFERTDQEKEILDDLIHNVERISGIIQRVLDFSRPSIGCKQKLNINPLIGETVALCEGKMRKSKIAVELRLSQDLPLIPGDPIQLQQVINNLILNAIETMDPGGGTLTVTTDYRPSPGTENTGRLCLQVADTGHGIEANNLENIFNPFFTTKPTGTGLGLAISHNIIEKHDGIMLVRSVVGEGTVFTVELPVWPDNSET
jgi:signal transduction histidine kinase